MIATTLICLAMALHSEARGEVLKGQVAVASVILNRASYTNSNICTVVNKPHQFPWAKAKFKKVKNEYVISSSAMPKGKEWGKSVALATRILAGYETTFQKIAYFHNIREHPKWKLVFAYQIGNHKFYYG